VRLTEGDFEIHLCDEANPEPNKQKLEVASLEGLVCKDHHAKGLEQKNDEVAELAALDSRARRPMMNSMERMKAPIRS
jgi:hypothetical protein